MTSSAPPVIPEKLHEAVWNKPITANWDSKAIKNICYFIQEKCLTRSSTTSSSGHDNTAAASSSCPFDAYPLLLQVALFVPDNQTLFTVQGIWNRILSHEDFPIEEVVLFGEMLLVFFESIAKFGVDSLQQASFDMPLSPLIESIATRQVKLPAVETLMQMLFLWLSALHHIAKQQPHRITALQDFVSYFLASFFSLQYPIYIPSYVVSLMLELITSFALLESFQWKQMLEWFFVWMDDLKALSLQTSSKQAMQLENLFQYPEGLKYNMTYLASRVIYLIDVFRDEEHFTSLVLHQVIHLANAFVKEIKAQELAFASSPSTGEKIIYELKFELFYLCLQVLDHFSTRGLPLSMLSLSQITKWSIDLRSTRSSLRIFLQAIDSNCHGITSGGTNHKKELLDNFRKQFVKSVQEYRAEYVNKDDDDNTDDGHDDDDESVQYPKRKKSRSTSSSAVRPRAAFDTSINEIISQRQGSNAQNNSTPLLDEALSLIPFYFKYQSTSAADRKVLAFDDFMKIIIFLDLSFRYELMQEMEGVVAILEPMVLRKQSSVWQDQVIMLWVEACVDMRSVFSVTRHPLAQRYIHLMLESCLRQIQQERKPSIPLNVPLPINLSTSRQILPWWDGVDFGYSSYTSALHLYAKVLSVALLGDSLEADSVYMQTIQQSIHKKYLNHGMMYFAGKLLKQSNQSLETIELISNQLSLQSQIICTTEQDESSADWTFWYKKQILICWNQLYDAMQSKFMNRLHENLVKDNNQSAAIWKKTIEISTSTSLTSLQSHFNLSLQVDIIRLSIQCESCLEEDRGMWRSILHHISTALTSLCRGCLQLSDKLQDEFPHSESYSESEAHSYQQFQLKFELLLSLLPCIGNAYHFLIVGHMLKLVDDVKQAQVNNDIKPLVQSLLLINWREKSAKHVISDFVALFILDWSKQQKLVLDEDKFASNIQLLSSTYPLQNTYFSADVWQQISENVLIMIRALSIVFRVTVYTNPTVAIWCLKELLTLWLSQSKLTFQLIQEDIEQLHVDVQVSMLCKSYPIELFDHIILPLISPASAAPTALHKHCFIVIADKVLRVGSVPFMSYFNGLIVSRLLDGSYLQLNQVSTVVQRIRDWKVPTSFKIPSKYLVDDVNLMLYHMLLSDFVSQKELLALLRGDWHTLLQSTAALLKLEITKLTGDDSKGNEAAIPSRHRGAGQDKSSASTKASQSSNQESIKSIMVASAFHQVLLPLVWGLGSSDETLAIRSKKGIQLICTCYHQKQWKLQEGNDRTLHALVEASASTIISTSFLFIISYLLQHQWKHQSNTQQIQSLTALQELIVTFFQPTDLIKFLPKIFNFVDTAFTNTCQQVRYKAVQIMVSICYMIPVDTIELHLCSIITGLYPIIEDKPVSGIVLQIGLDHATTTGNEMESYASQFAASLPTPNNKDNITQPLLSLQGIVQQAKDQLFYQSRAKQEAISLIRSLFIDAKYQSLASKLPLLPGIPDVDELKGVQHLHQQAIASLTFQQKLENMASLFTHETAQVRLIALRASRQILTEYKDDIYQVIADSMINPASSSHYEHSIAFIMKELLSLCSRETIYEVKLACAKCLGELGAIDPAFLRLPSLRSLQHSKNGTEDEFQYPWQMTLPQFGMIILRSYIVIGLKAASSSSVQDQSGFAIQMLLHLLHHHLKQQHHTQGLQPLVSTKSTRKKKDDAHEETSMVGQDQQMSPELRDSLNKSNIFDICEPFWFSKYHMNDPNSIRQPPIFTHGLSFSRWIGLLCRYLVSIASSPLQGIFHAVRGVVRNRIDLCQFLLPFLLLDVACYGSSEQLHGILHEFSAVLQDAKASDGNNQAIAHVDPSNTMAATSSVAIVSNPTVAGTTTALNLNQLCVQAVFRVLDTFTDWLSAINANKQQQDQQQKDNSTASASSSSTASSKDVFAHEQQIKEAINRVFDTLSLKLLCDAALSIKAYARAMRYFEIYTRQQHRVLRHIPAEERFAQQQGSESNAQSLSKKPNDRAGGELPILSQDQLDALATMYAAVEDTDALEGVQLVRRMYGHDESYRHRILELVQSDDWLGALLEYELLQNSQVYHNSLQIHLSDGSASKTGIADPTGTALSRAPSHRSNTTVTTDVSANTSTATSKLMSFEEINEVEKGKLQCLIELGHLESAIYHATGRSDTSDDLHSALIPLGGEAAWRLMKWDDVDKFVKAGDALDVVKLDHQVDAQFTSESDEFRFRVSKLLLAMQDEKQVSFQQELERARLQSMMSLAAASMESYGRAYPALCRLHTLHELETGFQLYQIRPKEEVSKDRPVAVEAEQIQDQKEETIERSHRWTSRVSSMIDSMSYRSYTLAVRRAIFGIHNMQNSIADNYLYLCHILRRLEKFDAAKVALKNAEHFGMHHDIVLLEECKILREQGHIQKALLLLEPVELDLAAINMALKSRSKRLPPTAGSNSIAWYLQSEEKKRVLAERIHLATQLMVEAQLKQGTAIVERYRMVIALDKKWDQAFLDFAKYYDFLYHDSLARTDNTANGGSVGNNSYLTSSYAFVEKAIEKYGQCLLLGQEGSVQALPRLLTLWLSFTSLVDNNNTKIANRNTAPSSGGGANSGGSNAGNELTTFQTQINEHMQTVAQQVSPSLWYSAMQQLVSRVLHRNGDTVAVLEAILLKVMLAFPKQGIWHIANLMFSLNTDRRKIAKKLLQETHRQIKDQAPEDGHMLVDAQRLFQNLSSLACFQCKEKRIIWKMDDKVKLSRFLVPTQTVLLRCDAVPTHSTTQVNAVRGSSTSTSSRLSRTISTVRYQNNTTGTNSSHKADYMFIDSLQEVVDVASSKAKPKTITLMTTCGKQLRFLCKQEKDGDLRKDARMMEFNNAVNRLFQQDIHGRKRKLRLRTYAVVCINEECGVLEWVNHTDCLRSIIANAHNYWPEIYPPLEYRAIYHQFIEMQGKYEDDIPNLAKQYSSLFQQYRPCLHRWYLETFRDATEWLEARTLYTRSVAVWSGVGHVIGLGDRHTENILIDVTNGECVHVDFDCLFDKGLILAKPEIIPFRLTQNMVDAMGVIGVEGCYRKTLEVTLKVLREHKDTLLSVLEPFLRDPTVAWGRSGRAQRQEQASAASNTRNTTAATTTTVTEQENKEAKEMLQRIEGRLRGVYNVMHPHRDKFLRAASMRGQSIPSRGIGPAKEELLPLSVQGQAQRLIDEATCIENLSQLYIGWQPWL